MDFAKEHLLGEIQGRLPESSGNFQEPFEKLLESNDENKIKINELVESCDALKEALDLECFSKIID